MRTSLFANDGFQIYVRAVLHGQACIECLGRLPSRLTELIGFKCALDDIGNRPLFSARKPMSKIARFGAADRKLWFSHGLNLVEMLKIYRISHLSHQDGM